MNTWCEPAPAMEEEGVSSFRYPVIVPINLPSAREASQAEREIRLERAQAAAQETARQQGVREGEACAAAEFAAKLEAEQRLILESLARFGVERKAYFRRVEADVVKLALAIARKLLHREAQVDPLLLSGVVRVALEQIQEGTRVVLRTSPAQETQWRGFLARLGEDKSEVEVVGDESLDSGRVQLETSSGVAEMSLEGKLKEIESGFFDLLQPGAAGDEPIVRLP